MDPLAALAATIESALQTGRIGTPVAVRMILHATADHGLLERIAGRAIGLSARWLASDPVSLAACGSADRGHLAALVRFQHGQSAVIAAGTNGTTGPKFDVVVWGNRGVLSIEGADALREDASDPQLSHVDRRILEQLSSSLRTGGAIDAEGKLRATEQPAGTQRPAMRLEPKSGKLRSSAPPFGVLLIAGDHTHQPGYAEALAADRRCRIVGLTDEAEIPPRRRQLNEALARRMNIPLLADLPAALRRDDVHIVSICAEPMRRGRIIVEAARAGKHLYLDKPLCGSVQDADAARKAVEEAEVVAHMWSFVHARHVRAAQAALQTRAVGEPTALHLDACFAKGHAGTAALGQPRDEMAAPEEYELADSKREMTNVGVYPLVSLLWLLRRPVRRVFASTGNYFFREHQQNGMEDFGQMLLELDDGMPVTICAGRTGWRSHPGSGPNRVWIAGSTGTVLFDAFRPRSDVWSDAECWTPPARDPDDPMAMWAGPKAKEFQARPKQNWIPPADDTPNADVRHFLDCIEQGRESDVPVRLAAAATEVLLAAYRSAASGVMVSLPMPR